MFRIIIWLSRYLLAATFIFSGFVKGVDPLGLAYKLGDYFMAFGLDIFLPITVPLSFILCAAEILIGLMLLFSIQNKVAIWGAFLFMIVFTPLTLVLAIFNPITDCGCFGDAIKLTNWETFYKNLPLLGASIVLLWYRKSIEPQFPKTIEIAIALALLIISFIPSVHGYMNLPLLDFRPYSVGKNISEGMTIPPDAPTDEFKTILYYEKDGNVKEFTQDNFPWQDSTWKFVDSESILIKKGYSPPITDFVLTDYDGWDLTDSILNSSGYYILAVTHNLKTANSEAFAKLNEIYFKAKQQGIGFACLTASPPSEIDRFVSKTGVAFPFLLADEIMLKTTIRSNPGLILLNQGTVLGKWHYRNIPDVNFFEGNLIAKSINNLVVARQNLWISIMALSIIAFWLIVVRLKKRK